MKKFGSIEQFRNIVQKLKFSYDWVDVDSSGNKTYLKPPTYPTVEFKGTVKIHGTNAGIVQYYGENERLEFQSRERILTPNSDNYGFAAYFQDKNLEPLFENIAKDKQPKEYIAVFGEWCGKSIQKGVGISNLEKTFIIFAYEIDGVRYPAERWMYHRDYNIYNVEQFDTYMLQVDLNYPELSTIEIQKIVEKVEKQCPVADSFGYSGIGEGVVFHVVDNYDIKFKAKGEKHSASKVKTIGAVDVDKINSIKEFVDYAVTENRLNQGIEFLKQYVEAPEITINLMGDFIRWVCNDIIKEESDTLESNNLTMKDVSSMLSNKARQWFVQYLDENL